MITITRRTLLQGMGASPLLFAIQPPRRRPKLAAICTTYFKYSHAQHIVDRFLESCLTSRLEGQKRLATSHLDVRYRPAQQAQPVRA